MRLVIIDNYDSFTYNLAQLFYELNVEVTVFRHDETDLAEIGKLHPDWICISPGPRDPAHAGISKAVVEHFAPRIPTLGVCLGMQVINEVFGGRTIKAPVPVHGKRSMVTHTGRGIFRDLPSPFCVARYHSLQIERRSAFIVPVANADDGVPMAICHRSWPLWGVQFHPESFMSDCGLELAANFLALRPAWKGAGLNVAGPCSDRFPRVGRGVSSHCAVKGGVVPRGAS